MCECAPLYTQCEYDEYKNELFCCTVHRFYFHLTMLEQSIPLIGKWIPDYECSDFCIKGCGTQE